MTKKLIACITVMILLFCGSVHAEERRSFGAYCVMEQRTGMQVAAENEQERMFPAGLTKLMSFLVCYEALADGAVTKADRVKVSENAASKGGSTVLLDAGAEYTFEELLRAAVVSSGNDAATALAEHIAGSEEAFTERMNERAAEMGLGCSFADPTGLSADSEASAAELAAIACALAEHADFFEHSTVRMYSFVHQGGRETELTNANKLIKSPPYDGMLTGSAREAGYCLAASIDKNGTRFICVVLDAQDSETRFLTASEKLSAASEQYTSHEIVRKGEKVHTAEITRGKETGIVAAEELCLLLPRNADYEKSIRLREDLSAPMEAGEKAGELIVTVSDGSKYAVELVLGEALAENSFRSSLGRVIGIWLDRQAA